MIEKILQKLIEWLEAIEHRESVRNLGVARNPGWSALRNEVVKENSYCEACLIKKNLQVHHIHPVWKYPEKEMEKTNLIVLCRKCHFLLAHLRSYHSYNLDIRGMAYKLQEKIKKRP